MIYFTDEAIVSFMNYFRANFPNENISPKMHLLEEPTVEWVRRYNFGFGMLGEQGAESIHSPFQRTEHHLQFNQKQREKTTVHRQRALNKYCS